MVLQNSLTFPRSNDMSDKRHIRAFQAIMLVLVIGVLMCLPATGAADDIHYDGVYMLASNGDSSVTMKLAPPMVLYQKLRENFSNLYLVLRVFASARADYEVVDKKADWDDPGHTMVFSMKMLGAGRNLGNHWELEIPKDAEFINVDEAKRTFYFNEKAEVGAVATIRGTSKLIMPAEAQQFKYDNARRVVSYVMPVPKVPSGGKTVLLILSVVLILGGAGLAAASFVAKGRPSGV